MNRTKAAILASATGLALSLPLRPAAAATLLLDLRADAGVATTGSAVDAWSDQSGAGNHVTATGAQRPTLITSGVNGKSALSFNDAQKMVGASATAFDFGAGDFTMVAVLSFPIADQGAGNSRILGNLSNNSPFGGFMLDADLTASRVAAVYREDTTGNQTAITQGANYPTNKVAVYVATRESTKVNLYLDNQVVGSNANSVNVNGDALTVGAERTGGAEFLTGDVYDIQMYSGSLTPQEVSNLQNTFVGRWSATPEPGGLTLLGVAAATLLARRRRHATPAVG